MDKEIGWDGTTSTVSLGAHSLSVDGTSIIKMGTWGKNLYFEGSEGIYNNHDLFLFAYAYEGRLLLDIEMLDNLVYLLDFINGTYSIELSDNPNLAGTVSYTRSNFEQSNSVEYEGLNTVNITIKTYTSNVNENSIDIIVKNNESQVDFFLLTNNNGTSWIVNSFLDNFFKVNVSVLNRCQIV